MTSRTLRGRAFVSGAASGIGLAIVRGLRARGVPVLAVGRDEARLRAALPEAHGDPGLALRAFDVRDEAALTAAVRAFDDLTMFANVAGVIRPAWVHEASTQGLREQLEVNVLSCMVATREQSRVLIERGDSGVIVNVASLAAVAAIPGIAGYSASKHALRAWSLAAAAELRPRGIDVCVVCPDAVQTPMLTYEEDFEQANMTFSGGVLDVDDVARAVIDGGFAQRRLEVLMPWSRGVMAKAAGAWPGLARHAQAALQRRGERARTGRLRRR